MIRTKKQWVATASLLFGYLVYAAWANTVVASDDRTFFSSVSLPTSIIDRQGHPEAMRQWDRYRNQKFNPLFDLGAWHGFLLPDRQNASGAFPGPMVIAQEYPLFISDGFEHLSLFNKDTKEQLLLNQEASIVHADLASLYQQLDYGAVLVRLSLSFSDSHTAVVTTELVNQTDKPINLLISLSGRLLVHWQDETTITDRFNQPLGRWSAKDQGVSLQFNQVNQQWDMQFDSGARYWINRSIPSVSSIDEATASYQSKVSINLQDRYRYTTHHHYFLSKQDERSYTPGNAVTSDIQTNRLRWRTRLDAANNNPVAIKALQTLLGNWRAPRGAIRSDGTVPSTTARWFSGIWAWDSWKHAVGLRHTDPQLAISSVKSMFDWQITADDPSRPQDAGMIIDAIFFNPDNARGGVGGNWNERNTKPPLASWAIWKIYQSNGDEKLLKAWFKPLLAYHQWWFRARDHNQNGVAEYGATRHPTHNDPHGRIRFSLPASNNYHKDCVRHVERLECLGELAYRQHKNSPDIDIPVIHAAAWESGMDNAPRFGFVPDAVKMSDPDAFAVIVLTNRAADGQVLGFSIDQESVDLNSFLAQEATLLASMAIKLNYPDVARTLQQRAEFLTRYINTCMFDAQTGYYYDLKLTAEPSSFCAGHPLVARGRGPEGWSPLFAGIADQNKAGQVVASVLNPTHFNLFLPTPTAARSNPGFDPDGYWQGRVWLDQWYFAIKGLRQYGFNTEADKIQAQLLTRAQGMTTSAPIRENYHPLNGAQQGATNFSWSAAALLDLLSETPPAK